MRFVFQNDCSPLYLASYKGHLDVVKTLFEAGANVDQSSKDGLCPLYSASGKGHLDVVKTLIEAGANVIQDNKDGRCPLYMASSNGHIEVVKTLIEAGAKVNQANKKGWSSLLIASSNGHPEVVKTLIEARADVNRANKHLVMMTFGLQDGWSPLYAASCYGHLEVVKTLIDSDAGVNQCDNKGWSPLFIASSNGHFEVVKTLIEARADVNQANKVAAKFLHEGIISPHNIDIFSREMNIAASVRHPNLLLFIGASMDESKPVILTELMPSNLRSCIEVSVLLRDQVISIGTDVACGLNYLHLVRPDPIIHRDSQGCLTMARLNFLTTMGPGNATYAAPESMNPDYSLQRWMCTAMAYSCLKWPLDSSQTKAYESYNLTRCCGMK
eukprot:Em0024g40a